MPIERSIVDRTLMTPLGEAAYKLAETIIDAGHACYWVGGATRSLALGIVPREIDMAVSATPAEIAALFPACDTTHAALGATLVSFLGHTFELTTFREEDHRSDGRRPASVRFGDVRTDALRRDATINAIYFHPISQEILDPCLGLSDIAERLVRFIGDPETRIRHDALRSLRMIRLRATIDGQYEPATIAAIRTCAPVTATLSGMRILQELDKLLACERPWIGLEDLWETGILMIIAPEIAETKGIAQPRQYHAEGDVWNHLLACTRAFTGDHGADVRLAALLHDIGKTKTFHIKERIRFDHHAEISAELASALLRRLQCPRARIEKIEWLLRHHMMMGSFASLPLERKSHWYYHPWFRELLQLFFLDAAGTMPQDLSLYDAIIADYNAFLNAHPRPTKPLLSGDDVMQILGVQPGPALGHILGMLHQAQARKEITTRKEALAYLSSLQKTKN